MKRSFLEEGLLSATLRKTQTKLKWGSMMPPPGDGKYPARGRAVHKFYGLGEEARKKKDEDGSLTCDTIRPFSHRKGVASRINFFLPSKNMQVGSGWDVWARLSFLSLHFYVSLLCTDSQ